MTDEEYYIITCGETMAKNKEFVEEAEQAESDFVRVEADVPLEEMGEFVKFSIHGESIAGTLEKRRSFKSQFGKQQTVYDIRVADDTDEGSTLWTITGNRDLNAKMDKVRDGAFVRITYLDDKPIPGQPGMTPMRIFAVDVSRAGQTVPGQVKRNPFKIE